MSILIKGIDMPKCSNEDILVVIRRDKAEVLQTGYKERTVEAIQIEIVRCKDCKYYRIKKISTGSEMPCCWQILGATPYREPEDFCSYGVRRTE